jgi:hypothetical protein
MKDTFIASIMEYVFNSELVHDRTEGTKIRAGDTSSQVLDKNAQTKHPVWIHRFRLSKVDQSIQSIYGRL